RTSPSPSPYPFPYTTLFRSARIRMEHREVGIGDAALDVDVERLDVVVDRRLALLRHHVPADGDPEDRVRERHDTLAGAEVVGGLDRKSTRLNSSHLVISYAV